MDALFENADKIWFNMVSLSWPKLKKHTTAGTSVSVLLPACRC